MAQIAAWRLLTCDPAGEGPLTRTMAKTDSQPGPDGALEIRVEDVHLAFGDNHVLRGVDLEVRRGEMVAIVGGSGCGKTVLLQVILGHLRPQRGRVHVACHGLDGSPVRPLDELSESELDDVRTHWAVVFQRNALFSGTVLDNIALWLREIQRLDEDQILPIARRALKAVGLPADEPMLAKHRNELSGGMQKRLAVARALAMNPILLFYDEPTTGLDPNLAEQVHELIRETHDAPWHGQVERTTVIITHDKDLLFRLRPRIVMLHEGRVYYDGTYDDFAESDSPIIRPYFDLMPHLQDRTVAAG